MKCRICGGELPDGAMFCPSCGKKIEHHKNFCCKCGSRIVQAASYCIGCGVSIEEAIGSAVVHEKSSDNRSKSDEQAEELSFDDSTINVWQEDEYNEELDEDVEQNNSDREIIDEQPEELIFDDSNIVSSTNNENRQYKKQHKKRLLSGQKEKDNEGALLLVIILIIVLWMLVALSLNLSFDKDEKVFSNAVMQQHTSVPLDLQKVPFDDISHRYTHMCNDHDVYVAVPISTTVIRIEHWDKTLLSSDMKFREEIGAYNINDEANGFCWIDEEHTAFTIFFSDDNNSYTKELESRVFTININDSSKNKGSCYDDSIASYVYQSDDFDTYRIIPLTDNLIKIECWTRSTSFSRTLWYAYDVRVIDLRLNGTDFEWTDETHSACTITMRDFDSSKWKESRYVAFILENPDYTYSNVVSYLGLNNSEIDVEESITSEIHQSDANDGNGQMDIPNEIVQSENEIGENQSDDTNDVKPTENAEIEAETEIEPEVDQEVKPEPPIIQEAVESAGTKQEEIAEVILPQRGTKLAKDLYSESKTTVIYLNTDGKSNVPVVQKWGKANVTDGIAEYLDFLKEKGFTITIISSKKTTPYPGFNYYETEIKISNSKISWSMDIAIEDEDYVEYELYIDM